MKTAQAAVPRSPPSLPCALDAVLLCPFHALSMIRYIGFLKRCALSKPQPELSIINTVNAMALATGRIPAELSREVFGDAQHADHLAYAGLPTARPRHLRSMPFTAISPHNVSAAVAWRRRQANDRLHGHLRDRRVRGRFHALLRRAHPAWDAYNPVAFEVGVCFHGVVRDRAYEKEWDYREDGFLYPTGDWSLNQHAFACACNEDTGVTYAACRDPRPGPRYVVRTAPPLPIECSQRAPFQQHEVIAYGLVKRWIKVRQTLSDGQELNEIIANVRVFVWSPELGTGCSRIRQHSVPPFDDHYMLARHIVCRITLSPTPDNEAFYLVSHVV